MVTTNSLKLHTFSQSTLENGVKEFPTHKTASTVQGGPLPVLNGVISHFMFKNILGH